MNVLCRVAVLAVVVLPAVALAQHQHPAVVPDAASFQQKYDFFTNYGRYMPRVQCLQTADGRPDWPWIGVLLALNVTVIAGYLRIFYFWRQCYLAEAPADRNTKLMDLAGIFLVCAACGYGFFILTFFWPAYRLMVPFLVALSIFTWRFATNLGDFRLSFSAKRLKRELAESYRKRNDELESIIRARTMELERANHFKGEFLANMSHELRTPMTAILGFADLLTDADAHPSERAAYVDTIRRNGQHLLGLVNDVLDLSKIEAGKLNVERVACDLAAEVAQVIQSFQPKADSLGLSLVCHVAGDVPKLVMTDPLRLRQILTNLVGNALKFTSRGGVTIDVALDPRPGRTPLLVIDVRDTGRGIPMHDLHTVFDRFGQSGPGRGTGAGSGLGLTISRNLARLLGGDITAASIAGEGSTFTVTLDAGDTVLVAADGPRAAPTNERQSLANLRVLVAEDMPDTAAYLRTLLVRWGATAEHVEDGRSAVHRATADNFDVILMDVQMPELDGLSATRELREGGYGGPIIALTANALVGDRGACLSAGCTDYASKPLDAARLLETIRRALTADVMA